MSGTDDKGGPKAADAGPKAGDKAGKAADAVLDDFWNEAVEEASAALQSDPAAPSDDLPPAPPPDDEVQAVMAGSAGEFEPLADPFGTDEGFEDVVLDAEVLSELDPSEGEVLDAEVLDEVLDGEILDGEVLDGEILEAETVQADTGDLGIDVVADEPVEEVLDAEFVADVDVDEEAEGATATPPPPPGDVAEAPTEPPPAAAEPAPAKPAPPDDEKRSPVAILLLLAAVLVVGFGAWKYTQKNDAGPDKPVDGPVVQRDDPGKFVEDKPVEDKPVEDKPVEDKPVEDKPVEDEPVEDEPVEDEPVVDKPVEDEPVEDKPAAVGLAGMVQTGVIIGRSKNVAKEGSAPIDAELRASLVKAFKSAGYNVGREGAYVRPYLTAFVDGKSAARAQCAIRVQANRKAKEFERFAGKGRSTTKDPAEIAQQCAESVVEAVKAQLPPK